MPLEKSQSDTTEVSNLMLNLNVTMQGDKTDWIFIAAFWNKFDFTNGSGLKNCEQTSK